jgi:hypothetical protein
LTVNIGNLTGNTTNLTEATTNVTENTTNQTEKLEMYRKLTGNNEEYNKTVLSKKKNETKLL